MSTSVATDAACCADCYQYLGEELACAFDHTRTLCAQCWRKIQVQTLAALPELPSWAVRVRAIWLKTRTTAYLWSHPKERKRVRAVELHHSGEVPAIRIEEVWP